jgi:hypothetical protein
MDFFHIKCLGFAIIVRRQMKMNVLSPKIWATEVGPEIKIAVFSEMA